MSSRTFASHFAAAAITAALALRGEVACAHGTLPRDVPLDRLVKNLDARMAKNPDDADLHYILGRLHALAFETGNESVPVWLQEYWLPMDETLGKGWRPTEVGDPPGFRSRSDPEARRSGEDEKRAHLREAVLHLNRALELAPAIASYHLALGSILESGLPTAREIDVSPSCPVDAARPIDSSSFLAGPMRQLEVDPVPSAKLLGVLGTSRFGVRMTSFRDDVVTALDSKRRAEPSKLSAGERQLLLEDWKEQIAVQYFIALALSLPSDGCQATQPVMGLSHSKWFAHEAAEAYVRVVTARGARPEDTVRLTVAKAAIDAFSHLPSSRAITPIVFPLDQARGLADLLEPSTSTTFDLDGTGVSQLWPWVARDTAILCWDPTRSGRITSGRQLFGSVSWWLFFANGYDALDALDDDRDGFLRGAELHGLSCWIDRDGNGRSDPGEGVPVEELGIVELSCRATGHSDESPCNPCGLRLASGTVLPTYDWVAHPLPEPAR